MPGMNSQRPFLPPQLMNPMLGGFSFPAGNKLPSNPNPLAKAAPAHTVKADAGGIQEAMAKRAKLLANTFGITAEPKLMREMGIPMAGDRSADEIQEGTRQVNSRPNVSDVPFSPDTLQLLRQLDARDAGQDLSPKQIAQLRKAYGWDQDPDELDALEGLMEMEDAGGSQEAMAKRAASLGLGNVPSGTGPQQMFNAMSMLGQAKALVDPTKTLKQERLSRGDFESKIDELSKREGDKYNFSEMRKDPKTHAILKGLLGALAGGGVGYLGGGGGIGSTLAGAGIGGLGGAGIGAMGAKNENRKLHSTAKVLKQYGLLQPEYLRQALPLLKQSAQDNGADRLSASGEESGVTFKHDDQGHLTGADAFKTLDGYMKKAGMNSFQRQFFGRLIQQGMDEAMIRASVKTAVDRFGEKIGNELTEGLAELEKVGFVSALRAIPAAGRWLFGQGARQALKKAPGAALQTAKQAPGVVKNFGKGLLAKGQLPRAGEFGAGVFPASEVAGNVTRNAIGNAARATGRQLQPVSAAVGRVGSRFVPQTLNKAVQRGIEQGGKQGLRQGVTHGAKHLGRDLTRRAAGTVSREGAKHLGIGAAHGAFNPFTGAHTWMDDEGNFDTQRALMSMGGSMLAGRSGMGRNLMARGLVGEGAGGTLGMAGNALGHVTGIEQLKNLDPVTMSQLGYGAGVASKGLPGKGRIADMIPGLASKARPGTTLGNALRMPVAAPFGTKSLLGQADLVGRGVSKLPGVATKGYNWARKNPGVAGLLGTGGYLGYQIPNKMDQFRTEAMTAFDNAKNDIQDQAHGYMEHYDPKIQQALSSANQASDRVNNLLGGQGGGLLSSLFGEGGQGGMMGGIGDYVQKNPWLVPLLLGGLGAGGGYAMGGGGGAALGGVAAPLLYMLATGQLGNTGGGQSGQDNAANTAEVQRRADENAKVTQGIENPVADIQQQQAPQQNEIQRQQQQQMAYA